ncbi:MAG: AmiB activator [Microgenomates bacterium OLB22]|nr:MAG: AmiB activator [Microgenomates bacterium OLB22]
MYMKKYVQVAGVFLLLFGSFSMSTQACSSKDECQKQIQEYEQKIKDLGQQKTSLTSQITIMNTKIALTEARIKNTQQLIILTTEEIQSLSVKIDDLNTSLDELTKILLHKIVEVYKQRQVSGYSYILNADNAGDEAVAAKYLQAAKRSDQILAIRIQKSKITFEEQKELREKKKEELENLTQVLDAQKKRT